MFAAGLVWAASCTYLTVDSGFPTHALNLFSPPSIRCCICFSLSCSRVVSAESAPLRTDTSAATVACWAVVSVKSMRGGDSSGMFDLQKITITPVPSHSLQPPTETHPRRLFPHAAQLLGDPRLQPPQLGEKIRALLLNRGRAGGR